MLGLFGPRSPAVISGPRPPSPIKVSTSSTSSHLVQSLWSCAHYFQWFTGYLNHVDLLMLHVATRFKEIALLFNVHLCFFCGFYLVPNWQIHVQSWQLKIRLICWMCSKLKINIVWHNSGVFIVDFDHSQHISIMLLLLTLNKYLSARCERKVIMLW